MFEMISNAAPEILKSAIGAALALVIAALLAAAKRKIFGRWQVEVQIDGSVVDTEPLSAKDGETMLKFSRPWWLVLLFGGVPTLERTREVRQNLQSAVTPYGVVSGDVRDATTVHAVRRCLVVSLQDGVNFQRRGAAPKKPA